MSSTGSGQFKWQQVSEDLVPVNITCIQDSPDAIFHITAYNPQVDKILDVRLVQPGIALFHLGPPSFTKLLHLTDALGEMNISHRMMIRQTTKGKIRFNVKDTTFLRKFHVFANFVDADIATREREKRNTRSKGNSEKVSIYFSSGEKRERKRT